MIRVLYGPCCYRIDFRVVHATSTNLNQPDDVSLLDYRRSGCRCASTDHQEVTTAVALHLVLDRLDIVFVAQHISVPRFAFVEIDNGLVSILHRPILVPSVNTRLGEQIKHVDDILA